MNALECTELFHRYFHCIEFCTLEGWLAHQRCIFHHWPSGTRYWDTVKHNEIQYVLISFCGQCRDMCSVTCSCKAEEYLPVKDVWPVTSKQFSTWRPSESQRNFYQNRPRTRTCNEIRCGLLLEKWICSGGLRWSTNSAQGGLVWQVHKYDEEELLMWFADIWNTYEHPDFILRMGLKLTTLGCSFAALGLWQWDNLHDEPMIEWSIHINPTFQDGSSAEKSS